VTRRGWILFAAMAVIWGIPYLFIKIAVGELTPASLVFLRTAIGAALLLPVAAARKDLAPLARHWRWILLYTLVEVAVPWFLVSDGEQRVSSSLAGLLIAATPSFGAILAWATGGERLDRRRILGLAVGFAGVGALVGLDVRADDLSAVVEILLVAVGYAIGATIIARKLSSLPSLGVVTASLALTAIAYAPLGVTQLPGAVPSGSVVLSVAVLSIVCTALGFLLFFPLIAEVGSARATVVTYLNPAVAVALGIAVLGEPLTFGIALGFVLIVVGSVLATWRTAARSTPETTRAGYPRIQERAQTD
jgi:drug/metabolite transporter (DMT)-like permease